MPSLSDYVCIGAAVLPSMKKNKMYNVRIVLSKHTARVERAICVCPAGLSGCCNHITATLYCVEDYFRLKLNEEDQKAALKSCKPGTSREKKVDAWPTNLVMFDKKVYGVQKRPKVCSINQWDCRPTSRRTVHPERKANLRNRLTQVQEMKTKAATCAVSSAVRKKATEAQSMLFRYGTSCFPQLLDDEPAPSENSNERIARAAAKRSHFQLKLSSLTEAVNHDHNYCNSISATQYEVNGAPAPQHLVRDLYEEHVCISPTEAAELEIKTRNQSLSKLWHEERKLRIASIMKTVFHRKPETNVIS